MNEPERDAWLRAALRHAPDAQVAPPAALSESILRQARAAARAPAAPAKPRGGWAAAWAWLARPPVATGFASVMVATVVGVMWWGRPMDEVLPRAPEVVTPAAAPAAASPPLAVPARSVPPPAAESKAADAAPDTAADTAPKRARAVAAPAPAPAPTLAQTPALTAQVARPRAEADDWRASVAAEPTRWAWQRGGAIEPMRPALQRWLAETDAPTVSRSAPAASGSGDATLLRLYRDGVLVTTLRVDDDARRRTLDDAIR